MPPPVAHDVTLKFGRPDIANFILNSFNATPSPTIGADAAGLVGTSPRNADGETGSSKGNKRTESRARRDSQARRNAENSALLVTPCPPPQAFKAHFRSKFEARVSHVIFFSFANCFTSSFGKAK